MGVDHVSLILTPTVLKEVDLHKLDERSSGRRAKVERLARQISEYRRRGSLLSGVPLVNGISAVTAIAIEPRMAESLSWLDPTNADDRLLASIIEVMRLNPHASVIVVSRDLPFQNKLEFARVPFISPSDLGIEERPSGLSASPATQMTGHSDLPGEALARLQTPAPRVRVVS